LVKQALKVFPTSGTREQVFTVAGELHSVDQLALYTLNGKKVGLENVQMHDKRLTFNVKSANPGLYVLRVSGQNSFQQKIMIY
jgi:hypothetical protein